MHPYNNSTIKIFIHQAVCELGLVLYAALDFGLGEQEERTLSEDIEALLDAMTEGNNGKRGFFPLKKVFGK